MTLENHDVAERAEDVQRPHRRRREFGAGQHDDRNVGPLRLGVEHPHQRVHRRRRQRFLRNQQRTGGGDAFVRDFVDRRTYVCANALFAEHRRRELGVAPGRRQDEDRFVVVAHSAAAGRSTGTPVRTPCR
jgi:hypothetical protein